MNFEIAQSSLEFLQTTARCFGIGHVESLKRLSFLKQLADCVQACIRDFSLIKFQLRQFGEIPESRQQAFQTRVVTPTASKIDHDRVIIVLRNLAAKMIHD